MILVPSTAACNSILRNETLFKGDTLILDITREVDSPLTKYATAPYALGLASAKKWSSCAANSKGGNYWQGITNLVASLIS